MRSLILLSFFLFSLVAFAEESCECQNSTCGACEIEQGVTFYSAKCGPGNARVKSCKKPTCVAVENQMQCLAELKGEAPKQEARKPASEEPAPESDKAYIAGSMTPVGRIDGISGNAKVTHPNQVSEKVRLSMRVYQGDKFETEGGAKVKVVFENGDDLIVSEKTTVTVTELEYSKEKSVRRTLLDLKVGTVRSRVEKNAYDDKVNTFKVRTKSAVAGVRGTDFVTSFNPSDKEWVTEIHTFDGSVKFGGVNQEKSVDVMKGTYASFVVEGPPKEDVSDAELDKFLAKGYMSEVFKMTEEKAKALEVATNFAAPIEEEKASRKISSEAVCSKPSADFRQCSWTCEGNPKGEKSCRTDMKNVQCVRRFCNANGEWTKEKRLPASQGDLCDGEKPVVKDCEGGW